MKENEDSSIFEHRTNWAGDGGRQSCNLLLFLVKAVKARHAVPRGELWINIDKLYMLKCTKTSYLDHIRLIS